MSQIWNAVKVGAKLKLGLSNPYRILPKYCTLSESVSSCGITFLQKKQINRNSYLMRFALPDPQKCVGLMIGQYIKIGLGESSRPYCPVSRIDEPGIVDIIVRDTREEKLEGAFTGELLELKEGDKASMMGPKTQFLYHGYGKMEWEGSPLKHYKQIGIVAYESAITGAYTLIDSIMPNYDNRTGVSLLWVGGQPEDFIFLEEFSMLAEQLRLNFNVMLREGREGWIGPYGRLSAAHLRSFMPAAGEETALVVLGGGREVQQLKGVVRQLGYEHVVYPSSSV